MDLFQELLRPQYWWATSSRMKYSADVILDSLTDKLRTGDSAYVDLGQNVRALLETNLLLLGFAVENAVKGYLVKQYLESKSASVISSFKDIQKMIWQTSDSHNLVSLFGQTAIELTDEERCFLKKLMKYSVWKGRYHLPKDMDSIKEEYKEGEGDRHTYRDQVLAEKLISYCIK